MIRELYERELDYLWSRLAVATRGRESLGPLWSRDGDARMSRLVQWAAYAFARAKEKLADDLPEISHALISCALPEALRPTPSATILQLRDPDRGRNQVAEQRLPRVESRPVDGAPCSFQACWPIRTAPISIERGTLRFLEQGVQVLALRVAAYPGMDLNLPSVLPDSLRVFVRTRDPVRAIDLVHALHASGKVARVRWLDDRGVELQASTLPELSIRWTALDHPLRIPGVRYDRFASGTGIRTLFSFPEAFAFFDIVGLDRLRARGIDARFVELSFELDRPVGAALSEARFELDCTPALNVFGATAVLDVSAHGRCDAIAIPGRPRAETFAIQEARLVPDRQADRPIPVRIWEEEGSPRAYDNEGVFVRLERRAPVPGEGVELCPTLLKPGGRLRLARGQLHLSLLATDGSRTEELGVGQVLLERDTFLLSNITRVTPPRSCPLGDRIPWRLNAHARMSVLQFAVASSFGAYLALHDPRPGSNSARRSPVVTVRRRRVRRVVGIEVHHGDEVDVELDTTALGGTGATWLAGNFLAMALMERADLLEYTHMRWVTERGRIEADYGVRSGERLPPPFG